MEIIRINTKIDNMTLKEVYDHVAHLIAEHGADARLVVVWNSETFRIDLMKV